MDVTKVFISRISPVWLADSTLCETCAKYGASSIVKIVIDETPLCASCARDLLFIEKTLEVESHNTPHGDAEGVCTCDCSACMIVDGANAYCICSECNVIACQMRDTLQDS